MQVLIVGIIVCLIIFTYKIYHYKIIFINVKLNSIEEKLKSTLIKRKELIKDSEILIKEILGTNKKIYENFEDTINYNNLIELDTKLSVSINEFYIIKDKYNKLQNNDDFLKLAFAINESSDQLYAYKNYYNKITKEYNKLIKKFPVILFSIFKGRKKKLYFEK